MCSHRATWPALLRAKAKRSDRVSAPHEPTGQAVLEASGENETTELEPLAGGYSLIELSPGETVGRYVVVRRVGAGAMGVVYEAHDPRLDRKVAIKVLNRHAIDPTESALAEARLLREARALAQLSHPNVVPVYDVGTTIRDDHEFIFLAMEFVEGQTLRAWIADEPPIARVLAVMKQAGRGLAAAHAAGLVHRDFKLDNVIIDASGRARVMDFRLARALTDVAHEDSDEGTASRSTAVNLGARSRPRQRDGHAVSCRRQQSVGSPRRRINSLLRPSTRALRGPRFLVKTNHFAGQLGENTSGSPADKGESWGYLWGPPIPQVAFIKPF